MDPALQDLILYRLEPAIYIRIWRGVAKRQVKGAAYIREAAETLYSRLHEHGLECRVQGRVKHVHSIYRKLKTRGIGLADVCDLMGLRIIVGKVGECYEALEVVHSLWRPVPGRFKDYITEPKANMYRSLHTTLVGPCGELIEVQIRTGEMHQVAEKGAAAHWRYKAGWLAGPGGVLPS